MTKKNILKVSSAYIVYFILLLLISTICHSDWCSIRENGPFGLILFSFAPLLLVFLLSLLTYRMHDRVFRAWFHFALWFVPIIILTTLFFETRGGGGGGWGISSGMDEFAILWLLYIIFILTSLWKIIRAYRETKTKK